MQRWLETTIIFELCFWNFISCFFHNEMKFLQSQRDVINEKNSAKEKNKKEKKVCFFPTWSCLLLTRFVKFVFLLLYIFLLSRLFNLENVSFWNKLSVWVWLFTFQRSRNFSPPNKIKGKTLSIWQKGYFQFGYFCQTEDLSDFIKLIFRLHATQIIWFIDKRVESTSFKCTFTLQKELCLSNLSFFILYFSSKFRIQ